MEYPREILLPHKALAKMLETFNWSRPTVRKALRFEEGCDSDEMALARKIRYVAQSQFGGIDSGAPDPEIKNNIYCWKYQNGAILTINFNTGFATMLFDGRLIESREDLQLSDVLNWQIKAENLR